MKTNKTIVLLILDGWGLAPKTKGNAIEQAVKPNYEKLWEKYSHTKLVAHGSQVGLPKNQVGNSEAGHMNIGAGFPVKQDSVIISESIRNGRFEKNNILIDSIKHAEQNAANLHIFGLLSKNGSPHSDKQHMYALVNMAAKYKVKNIFLHFITDGRDSPQYASIEVLDEVEKKVKGKAKIVTVMGRFYAMDRVKNWQRTQKAYDCLTAGKCRNFKNLKQAVLHSYNKGITDEFIEPATICSDGKHVAKSRINDNDSVIFFNLRSDRARQIAKTFAQKDFNRRNKNSFKRNKVIKNLTFTALTDFGPDLDGMQAAFPGAQVEQSVPKILENVNSLYIAETEKYAHVTYFFNGGYKETRDHEKWQMIPSPKVKSYDLKPEMSVYKIAKQVVKYIEQKKYDFITINFANPDMVGHTGNLPATIKAIEHTDKCLGEVSKAVLKNKGELIVTADHGNAEKMLDLKTDEVWTWHTTNPVPLILVSDDKKGVKLFKKGDLTNIAPTIYQMFNIKKIPKGISGSLIK